MIAPENPNTVRTAMSIWGTIFAIIATLIFVVPALGIAALAIAITANHGIH